MLDPAVFSLLQDGAGMRLQLSQAMARLRSWQSIIFEIIRDESSDSQKRYFLIVVIRTNIRQLVCIVHNRSNPSTLLKADGYRSVTYSAGHKLFNGLVTPGTTCNSSWWRGGMVETGGGTKNVVIKLPGKWGRAPDASVQAEIECMLDTTGCKLPS